MESDDAIMNDEYGEDWVERYIVANQRVDNSDDTSEEIGSPMEYFNVQLEE